MQQSTDMWNSKVEISKALCWMKERLYNVWLYLYDMLKNANAVNKALFSGCKRSGVGKKLDTVAVQGNFWEWGNHSLS